MAKRKQTTTFEWVVAGIIAVIALCLAGWMFIQTRMKEDADKRKEEFEKRIDDAIAKESEIPREIHFNEEMKEGLRKLLKKYPTASEEEEKKVTTETEK